MYRQHMFDGFEILHCKLFFIYFSIIFIVLVKLACCREHLCSFVYTLVAKIDSKFYVIGSLSSDVSAKCNAKLEVAWL